MSLVRMTPKMIQDWFVGHSHRMDRPESFYGDEVNSYREDREGVFHKVWDEAQLRVLYAAPWPYSEFAGNMTFPLLNMLTNEYSRSDGARPFYSERSHHPCSAKDLLTFTKFGVPIFGLETRHVPADFDIVAFSLGFSPFSANIVKQLRMAGIPVRWRERESMEEPYPLVIGGGSTSASPEIWAPIADFVFVGEAEDEPDHPGLMAVYEDILGAKEDGSFWTSLGREELLHSLAVKYDFLYVPKFFEPRYNASMDLTGWSYKYDDIPKRVRWRSVRNLDAVPATTKPLIPYVDPTMGLGEIEISRGCSSGVCTFCAVGFRYRPYRERSVEYMVEAMRENIRNSGADQAYPTAFEFSGYTRKKELTRRFLTEVTDSMDTQSQRIDSMAADPNFVMLAGEGSMKNLCVGIEGNSERIRTYVNKGAPEETILKACENAMRAGFKTLKLYMIANLPVETEEDTLQIVDLCAKITALRDSMGAKAVIKVSWTPLLVEAWTPLQWSRCTVGEKGLKSIANPLRELGITFMLHQNKTELNYLFSVQVQHICDRIAAEALVDSYIELDADFYGSANRKLLVTLERNLRRYGVDGYKHYFREKPKDFVFPWDIIDIGVTKEYLWGVKRATEEALRVIDEEGGDPRGPRGDGFVVDKCASRCTDCGVCDAALKRQVRQGYAAAAFDADVDLATINLLDHSSVLQKVRVKVFIDSQHRYPGADYWTALLRRAATMTDVPLTKRTIHFASEQLRWKNWVGGVDYVEFGMLTKSLRSKADVVAMLELLNTELVPYGLTLLEGRVYPPKMVKKLFKEAEYSLYEMPTPYDKQLVISKLKNWRNSEYMKVMVKDEMYRVGLTSTYVNGKDFVKDIWAVSEGPTIKLMMYIKGKPSPFDIYRSLFHRGLRAAFRETPVKLDVFVPQEEGVQDFFRPVCEGCGESIPVNYFDQPLNKEFCPRCYDVHMGRFIG